MLRKIVLYCFMAMILLNGKAVLAQCANTTISGYNSGGPQLTTANQLLVTGITKSACVSVEYHPNGGSCSGWKLNVKAMTPNFTNGSSTVPVGHISLRYNGTGGTTLPLSTSGGALIQNGATLSGYYTVHKLDFIVEPGNHLIVPNGTYSATLMFSFLDNNDNLISSFTMSVNFQINYQGPNLGDYCADISLSGDGGYGYTFNTYSQLMTGATVTDAVTLRYSLVNNSTNCPGWKLTVKATSPYFSNGTNNVSIANSAIQFNRTEGSGPSGSAIGITTGLIPLSTSESVIIAHSNARLQAPPNGTTFTQKFDLVVQGGAYLIQPSAGAYTVDLIFSIYDENNQLISAYTISDVGFQNQYNGNTSISLELQNGGNSANFDFSTIANRTNGISLVKNNALKITAYNNYQVFAQTLSDDLVASSSSLTLPASVIHLAASLSNPISGVSCYTIQLSSNNTQPLITNTNPAYPNQTVEYNLNYFINGNDPDILFAPGGNYSGTLVFVAQPL